MSKPASDKQVAFLTTLVSERVYEGASEFATLTSAEASALIGQLLNAPRKSSTSTSYERITEEGVYQNAEGDIFRVQRSRESGNLYAKRLDIFEGGFVYEAGLLRNITPSDRLNVEQAKALGVQYGFCVVCGILLTDPKSVEQGIGPVCIKRV
jgi:hypothetical protein